MSSYDARLCVHVTKTKHWIRVHPNKILISFFKGHDSKIHQIVRYFGLLHLRKYVLAYNSVFDVIHFEYTNNNLHM